MGKCFTEEVASQNVYRWGQRAKILGRGNSLKKIQGSANTDYRESQDEGRGVSTVTHLILEYLKW